MGKMERGKWNVHFHEVTMKYKIRVREPISSKSKDKRLLLVLDMECDVFYSLLFTFTLYTENALECFYIRVVTVNRICNMHVLNLLLLVEDEENKTPEQASWSGDQNYFDKIGCTNCPTGNSYIEAYYVFNTLYELSVKPEQIQHFIIGINHWSLLIAIQYLDISCYIHPANSISRKVFGCWSNSKLHRIFHYLLACFVEICTSSYSYSTTKCLQNTSYLCIVKMKNSTRSSSKKK